MHDWIKANSPVTASFYPPEKLNEYKKNVMASYPELRGRMSELRFQVLRRVFLQSGHDSDSARSMARDAFSAFYQARSTGLTLFDGVDKAFSELKKYYPLIAITNGNADLEIAGFEHLFDYHIKADDFDAPKPAPDMFEAALAKAGVRPEQAIHIGDHPEQDIEAALQLGMKTLWFNEKRASWPLKTSRPHAEFSHWSQLVQQVKALADS